jgi:hypothetical protein
MIARELQYLNKEVAGKLLNDAFTIGRELNALISAIESRAKAKGAGA